MERLKLLDHVQAAANRHHAEGMVVLGDAGPRILAVLAEYHKRECKTYARKKAPRKAHVPGGQRTLLPFRERLDAITPACGRMQGRIAMGGAQSPSIGECIVADDGRPCQRQPLRGRRLPIGGGDPTTWFVSPGIEMCFARRAIRQSSPVKCHFIRNLCRVVINSVPKLTAACPWSSVVGRENTTGENVGQG
jgi:hypothetical protein